MKNKLLLCFVLLLTTTMNAQFTVVDFEDDGVGKPDTNATAEWVGDPNVPVVTTVANPSIGGINTSANCVKYVETTGSNAGNSLQFAFGATTAKTGHNLSVYKFIKIMVYSENQTTFDILLEIGLGGTPNFSETKTVTTPLNTWTEVIFDFTGNGVAVNTANYGNWNSNIRIHFNNGSAGVGDTYYVDNYILDTPKYATVADGDYATGANWLPSNVPLQITDDVDIKHNITYTGNLSLKKLLVRNNKSLNITGNLSVTDASQLWGGASLIVSGTSTGSYAYFRTLSTPAATGTPAIDNLEGWHLLSSPVSNETYDDSWISSFGVASGSGSNRGIATYNNAVASNNWSYATAPVASTAFGEGKGYSIKRTTSGNVQFIGNIRTANITNIALTKNTSGYNLVGNPYSSYVSLNDLFTANNSGGNDLLTESTIWIWNSDTKNYDPKGVSDNFQIAPGQGFFVEASAAANTFTFNTSMLSHQSDPFLKSSNTEIQLNITDGNASKYAKINYLDNATTSFDDGYDSKLFGGVSQPFAVYTQLVSNNEGKNYQVQALPNSNFESMIIAVGVNADSGKEITFSAEALNLPSELKVFLEDRLTSTFTRLDEVNTNYKVTLTEAVNGIGRFYLHTSAKSTLSLDSAILNSVSIYKTTIGNLKVVGLQNGKATISLFNVLGKQVMNTYFDASKNNDISLPKLATGIYIVKLETEKGTINKKIILE